MKLTNYTAMSLGTHWLQTESRCSRAINQFLTTKTTSKGSVDCKCVMAYKSQLSAHDIAQLTLKIKRDRWMNHIKSRSASNI
ncbi:RNA-directed RNA polymerase L [Bienertia sinuspersici]